MSIDRAELAKALAEATGWSVTADPRRFTFVNDDPPQVVIWTVTDAEISEIHYSQNVRAKGFGGSQTNDPAIVGVPLDEALGPFELFGGSRGYMDGTDLTIRE
ncbi:hypothetical protein [Brevibacterium atlanticum]|uniref:hypothetical protein n=1 Tax=Brevibacterium atlanticum TaxID=2697563 RepID=UPI0014215B49|nr:hypothetical protein [Brevibacterium atlanticum]